MSIQKYAYLLDNDNLCVENKIFIDLMWYIAKNKDNGENKPKGMVTIGKNGKAMLSVKSYVVRNAGIMLQQLFYWHNHYLKTGKATTYQYNNSGKSVNVVKKDLKDWWNDLRLTERDITSANKLLVETGLVIIHVMRIKEKGKEVYRPSNCYEFNFDLLEMYLDIIVEVSSSMYDEKVKKAIERNNKSSIARKNRVLLIKNSVTAVTAETLKTKDSEIINKNLPNINEQVSVTAVSAVTKATAVSAVTKATAVSAVTNNSDSTCSNSTWANTTLEEEENNTQEGNLELIKRSYKEVKGTITLGDEKQLEKLLNSHSVELIIKAIEEMTLRADKPNLKYVINTLKDWNNEGLTTLEAVNIHLEKYEATKNKAKENKIKKTKAAAENKTYGKEKKSTFGDYEQRNYSAEQLKAIENGKYSSMYGDETEVDV